MSNDKQHKNVRHLPSDEFYSRISPTITAIVYTINKNTEKSEIIRSAGDLSDRLKTSLKNS